MSETCTGCQKPLESNCNQRYVQVRHPMMNAAEGLIFDVLPAPPSIPSGDWHESCLLAAMGGR